MSIICCQKVFRIIQNLHQNGRPSRMEALLKCRHYLGIAHGEGGSQRLPGWVGKTFIRNEVPQRARLSAGRRVQKLFGQCPNSACMTLIGASLHPPPPPLFDFGGVLTLAWICRFGALLSEMICRFGALLSAGRGVAKAIWAIPK